MRKLTLAVALLLVAMMAPASAQPQSPDVVGPGPRIIGGSTVPDGKYPFAVALQQGTFQFCGGSVIAPTWVLTAAHCVTDSAGAPNIAASAITAVIGRYDLDATDGEAIAGTSLIVHPMWDGEGDGTFEYDFALIELSSPTLAAPVTLATVADAGLYDDAGDEATVMGWGYTDPGSGPSSTILKEVDVPIVTDATCTDPLVWGGFVNGAVELCAGDDDVDSCVGDSGGPLVAPPGEGGWTQIGIVSSGPFPCADAELPGIYAEVAAEHSWIDSLVDLAPTAVDDDYSLAEDSTLTTTAGANGVADNDTDSEDGTPPGGDAVLITPPLHHDGVFALASDGSFSYDPDPDFFGIDSFTYTVKDSGGLTSNTATVTITINPVNDAPSFSKGADELVLENAGPQTVAGWVSAISPGPANESGQAVSFLVTDDNNTLFATQPAVDAAGTLTYTPASNAIGTATVTVTAMDDGGTSDGGIDTSAPQAFTIAVTDAPLAVDDAYVVLEDGILTTTAGVDGVADNDTDAEDGTPPGGPVTLITPPLHHDGVFALAPDGSFAYEPIANFNGADSFAYTVKDSAGNTSEAATVTITINAVDDPPSFTKGPDQVVLEDAGPQTITAWADPVTAGPAEGGQPVWFTVTNDNEALFSEQPAVTPQPSVPVIGILTFSAAPDANGSATVTVTAMDSGGASAPQTFTITVHPVNDPPSFTKGPDAEVVENAGSQTVPGWATAVSAGPLEEAGQTVSFVVSNDNNALFATQPAVDAAGTLTYTPAASKTGTATVTVTAGDDGGTANGGVDTSTPQVFTIAIGGIRHTTGLVDIATATWHLRNSVGAITSFLYGNPGDLPIAGDWNADGISTPGLYRQFDGFFYARNSNSTGVADAECFAGNADDVPLSGDWDGDGDDNLGIYRPSEQRFYLYTITCTGAPMGAAQISLEFGDPGDKPVAGDWDGDGIDEIGLHRESTGLFYWRNDLSTGIADGQIIYGNPDDRFVAGDWGLVDGADTPMLFRPEDLTLYFRHTLTQGNADSQLTWTSAGAAWLPVAGRFGLG